MDLCFRRDPAENPAIISEVLYAEPFSLIVPADHRLNQENFTCLADVKDEKFILTCLHHKTYYVSTLRKLFSTYAFVPKVHVESDFGGMVLCLVAKGLGVSIMPGYYAIIVPPNVRFINLSQQTNLYAVWRKDDHNPGLKNVLAIAKSIATHF